MRFEYLEGGKGDVLVLLHGFGANKDNWTRFGKHLTPHFRVIAPDLPGFGESSLASDNDYTISIQAERVRAFIKALGIKSLHIGGNSMGGYIAGVYASRYTLQKSTELIYKNGNGFLNHQPSFNLRCPILPAIKTHRS